jgi:hypothetical protein
MNPAEEYLKRCLADCPSGQEDALLTALARHLFTQVGLERALSILRTAKEPSRALPPVDMNGPVLPEREDSPEFIAEVERRLKSNVPCYPVDDIEYDRWLASLEESSQG